MKIKKIISFYIMTFFIFSTLSDAFGSAVNEKEFLIVGSGSMMGVYYPIGGSICKLIMDNYKADNKKLVCSVSSTPGSVYNLNSMRGNNIDMGIVQYDLGYNAYYGLDMFKNMKPMSNLRVLAKLHKEYLTILTKKDANIRSTADFKGKRINIGAPGTGIRGLMLKIMEINGWTKNDFAITSELKASEQAQALCDNKVDVIAEFTGHPSALVQEATFSCGAVLVNVDDRTRKTINEKYPYYEDEVIKANIYKGNPNDINTISVRAILLARSELNDLVAYDTVKYIFNSNLNKDKISNDDSGIINAKNMIPLHKGAKKYYKEIGLLK